VSRALAAAALTLLAGAFAPAAGADTFRAFHTPSGNIGCVYRTGSRSAELRCDIGRKSWRGGRPAGCQLDAGDSLVLHAGDRPRWLCHGDTALHEGPVLAYGRVFRAGPFSCSSRATGLTCSNRAAHGFTLAIQAYRVY
jgi:hypothetical protein